MKMKRRWPLVITILVIWMTYFPQIVCGAVQSNDLDFSKLFEDHGAVMLIIDPSSGDILYANHAATEFYGYEKSRLLTMNISDINTLTTGEIEEEMHNAVTENRNYFVFRHRLSNREVRSVEVYSYPVAFKDQTALMSIIYDITEKTELEAAHRKMIMGILMAGGLLIVILSLLIIVLHMNHNKLKGANARLQNFNALRETFINADNSLIYLKDENLKYVFVNQAVENFYQRHAGEIIGQGDEALSDSGFAEKRRRTDLDVLEKGTLIVDEVEWDNRIYQTTKFPVAMLNGAYGVGAYVRDITQEREQLQKQKKILKRNMLFADVLTREFESRKEQLDFVLYKALELTDSMYGYIYLYEEEKEKFTLSSWTKGVAESCELAEKQLACRVKNAGIWGEAVRQRKPVIVNDSDQNNPLRRAYSDEPVPFKRFISVPVMLDGRFVSVIGLVGKKTDYDENDVSEISLIMNGVWNSLERKAAQDKLIVERNKYLQILVSIGDGVLAVNRKGRVEMLNTVAENLTGWSAEQARGRYYKDILVLAHENEEMKINDPIEEVLRTDTPRELNDNAVLISKNGDICQIEDSAAPVKDDKGNTLGVVLVFRDISYKKEQRRKIEFLSFHDTLTGLYNRSYFEEEMRRLDAERNLPISIIMGDINGLKLTNDIFGHAYGDILLKKIAEVFRRICRKDDIIARWGGDEFIVLLPQSTANDARQIMYRVKSEFANEKIKAIRGSISLGMSTKNSPEEHMEEVLERAENEMYAVKALERNEFKNYVIHDVIEQLYKNNDREREHSYHVSVLAQEIGRELNLADAEVHRLKDAGYFHDIGKIVLNPGIFTKAVLDAQDYEDIAKHPIVGYRILNSFDETMDLAEFILAHHEWWDGTGYPKGLKGDQIPLLARIIAVAEFYDRLLHDPAHSTPDARRGTLRDHAGKRLDPQLVEVLIRMLARKGD